VPHRIRKRTHARLCCGPAGESELIELEDDSTKLSPFPLVQCRNIYVLPGVPTLLQTKWRTLKVLLMCKSARVKASMNRPAV